MTNDFEQWGRFSATAHVPNNNSPSTRYLLSIALAFRTRFCEVCFASIDIYLQLAYLHTNSSIYMYLQLANLAR